jgi:hypothetical protein
MMQSITDGTQPSSWKRLLLGTVTALLLVPVPVYSAYTLGDWSVTPGSGWAVGAGSGNKDLFIIPQPGFLTGDTTIDFTAPVLSGATTTNNVTVTTTNFDTIQNITAPSGGGLTLTIAFADSNGNPNNSGLIYGPNQFTTGNVPQPLLNPAPGKVTVNPNQDKMALVRFEWTGIGTNWSVPSTPTPIHITFTP